MTLLKDMINNWYLVEKKYCPLSGAHFTGNANFFSSLPYRYFVSCFCFVVDFYADTLLNPEKYHSGPPPTRTKSIGTKLFDSSSLVSLFLHGSST